MGRSVGVPDREGVLEGPKGGVALPGNGVPLGLGPDGPVVADGAPGMGEDVGANGPVVGPAYGLSVEASVAPPTGVLVSGPG